MNPPRAPWNAARADSSSEVESAGSAAGERASRRITAAARLPGSDPSAARAPRPSSGRSRIAPPAEATRAAIQTRYPS